MEGKFLGKVQLSTAKKLQISKVLRDTEAYHSKLAKKSAVSDFQKELQEKIDGSIDDKLCIGGKLARMYLYDDALQAEEVNKLVKNRKYRDMMKYRKQLPIYGKRLDILKIIEENQVVLISGETGCGKTTQVTQFILDSFIASGDGSLCKIVCTQPRRISAIAVAERVAEERGEDLGQSCGYQIRLEKEPPRKCGSILYCTTGIILRQMGSDPLLLNISHLILDEIHERDVMSDFIIAIMRKVLPQRPDLKLILMSATLNANQFSRYYGCPIITVPGVAHEVTEHYLEDVLQLTGFVYSTAVRDNGNMGRKAREAKAREDMLNHSAYDRMIRPYIQEARKKYSSKVCEQLKNPRCEEINLDLILKLIKHICTTDRNNGGILVFVTGYMEIWSLIDSLYESYDYPEDKYIILAMHSQMESVDQKHIFEPAPPNTRKIIISTNIAETSITINDVVHVIDCGFIKQNGYNPKTDQQTLDSHFVSQASALQRKGRAGRVRPGVCYHLFSRARAQLLDKFQLPEIKRRRLDNVVLHLKSLQLGKAKDFLGTLIDAPEEESVDVSIQLLKRINALDSDESLTALGYHLSRLPMSPQIGKMIMFGVIFSCLDPILSIAVTLDFKDAFQIPRRKSTEADERKYELAGGIMSDHLLSHIVLEEYHNCEDRVHFCKRNFLNKEVIDMLLRMKLQFWKTLVDMNYVSNSESHAAYNENSQNMSLVKSIVCAGLFPNIALITNRQQVSMFAGLQRGPLVDLLSESGAPLRFLRKSILSRYSTFSSPLITYHQRMKSGCDYVHDATLIYPLTPIFFADKYRYMTVHGECVIAVSDRLLFTCSESTSEIIRALRVRLNKYIHMAIEDPKVTPLCIKPEGAVIRLIIDLITKEDQGIIDPAARLDN